ncbi:hypothetical protein predicted by Glimmer/Critica [Bdellovibrio bacteriovorus HD100]|uniref:Uncharacterized protein n=1 Tax=Bdellovibrio bacteriovorus (strain ATCC 15356 / DSM 50701 / NCIMB 9529 / HD100) TaxID=264462 RepID=Q6MN01_BDEBA|nr:hypothetical protein predicted by Glimmer/Critica [Bdellovibrio bacteriovorus HD100]
MSSNAGLALFITKLIGLFSYQLEIVCTPASLE